MIRLLSAACEYCNIIAILIFATPASAGKNGRSLYTGILSILEYGERTRKRYCNTGTRVYMNGQSERPRFGVKVEFFWKVATKLPQPVQRLPVKTGPFNFEGNPSIAVEFRRPDTNAMGMQDKIATATCSLHYNPGSS